MTTASPVSRRLVLAGAGAALATLAARPPAYAAPAARQLAGVFPIGFTPVKADETVDFDALAAQFRFCQKGGVHGLAWPQIASGWTALTEAERIQGAQTMADVARGGKTALVIGVQSKTNDFAETERYAKHAEKAGADGLIGIPPTGASPDQILAFYQQLGKVTGLPVFVQAVGEFSVDLLVRINEAAPTVRFVKDEAGDPIKRVREITSRTSGRMKSFSGNGVRTLVSEMEAGFSGCCPFTSLSDVYASAFDDFHAGRRRRAFDQFGRILAFSSMVAQNNINILVARGVFKPGTKTRAAPAAPGSNLTSTPLTTPDEIKRALDNYLRPYLRA